MQIATKTQLDSSSQSLLSSLDKGLAIVFPGGAESKFWMWIAFCHDGHIGIQSGELASHSPQSFGKSFFSGKFWKNSGNFPIQVIFRQKQLSCLRKKISLIPMMIDQTKLGGICKIAGYVVCADVCFLIFICFLMFLKTVFLHEKCHSFKLFFDEFPLDIITIFLKVVAAQQLDSLRSQITTIRRSFCQLLQGLYTESP